MGITMKKFVMICILGCLFLSLNGFAKTFVVQDTQDATNWGDWFLPEGMDPRSGSPPKYLPYYRWDDNDWGWTHTIVFGKPPAKIISATLEIEAWDVDVLSQEINEIFGDGIYIGHLTPGPDQTEISNSEGYTVDWNVSTLTLGPDALLALLDGKIDIWMDIDADTTMEPGLGCEAVTLRSSTLTVYYSDGPADEPSSPPDEPNLPQQDPNKPPVDPNGPTEPPTGGPKVYRLYPVDVSLPTFNDPGDGIGQIGVEQAWFAFDLSSIPDEENIVSATFSADMVSFSGLMSQRTLWYDSDDSWIFNPSMTLSDPGNKPADYIVGTVRHDNTFFERTTIEITHDWSNDLVDDYITLMLTGPQNGLYASGAVDLTTAELEITTSAGPINNGGVLLSLGPEEIVQAGGLDIVVPGYSVPSLFDWNNDGLQDLIIGEGGGFGDARVRFYLNIGTESEPMFLNNLFLYAQSYTSDLTCPASGCLGCFPRVVYWDADERKDLLIGQSDGMVKIFLNIFIDEIPIFDGGTFLQVGQAGLKNNIDVGARATPTVVDWNNDGKKDLVIGALDGMIHLFINKGTDAEPDFTVESFAQENGADLVVPGGRSSPEILDLDEDGRKDILTGNTEGQLFLYHNVGTDKDPQFSGFSLVESDGMPIDLPDSARSRPFVCDWTSDGYYDVLVGAGDGKVHLYQSVPLQDDVLFYGDLEPVD
jgi:hypothetical protein